MKMKLISKQEYENLIDASVERDALLIEKDIRKASGESHQRRFDMQATKIKNLQLAIEMRDDQINRLVDQLVTLKAYANSRDSVVSEAKRDANASHRRWSEEKNLRLGYERRIEELEEQLEDKEEAIEIIRNYVETV